MKRVHYRTWASLLTGSLISVLFFPVMAVFSTTVTAQERPNPASCPHHKQKKITRLEKEVEKQTRHMSRASELRRRKLQRILNRTNSRLLRAINSCISSKGDLPSSLAGHDIICLKGDVNDDGLINAQDINPFISVIVGQDALPLHVCAADINNDGAANALDIRPFLNLITSQPVCGNNLREAEEVCDGADLAGQTCETLGYSGGILACTLDCASFDVDQCISIPEASVIIADHTVVDQYADIPQYYIDQVKRMFLNVPGESHSEAYRRGLELLEQLDSRFQVNVTESGEPEGYTDQHLRVSQMRHTQYGWNRWGTGEQVWFTNAAGIQSMLDHLSYANTHGTEIAAMGFGWCWDMSRFGPRGNIDPVYLVRWAGNTVGSPEDPDGNELPWGLDAGDITITGNSVSIDTYLSATQHYNDFARQQGFPTKTFFTTGPADSAGETGYQVYLKHQRIRTYVQTHGGILFDYAEILSFNDNGSQATRSWQDYAGQTHIFEIIHPHNDGEAYGHIGEAGALRLAKALWYMLARIGGWDGVSR